MTSRPQAEAKNFRNVPRPNEDDNKDGNGNKKSTDDAGAQVFALLGKFGASILRAIPDEKKSELVEELEEMIEKMS